MYDLDVNITILALRSLTYTYNSTFLPEPVFNTSRYTVYHAYCYNEMHSSIIIININMYVVGALKGCNYTQHNNYVSTHVAIYT